MTRLEIRDETIKLVENNDTLLTIQTKKLLPDGSTIPYTLNGATIELFVKDDLNAGDPSANANDGTPFKQTSGITITDTGEGVGDTYGEFTIQIDATNVPTPITRYYRFDVLKAGKRQTVKKGFWKVENA